MNERIKELIKQATNPDYDSDDGPMNELNIEKFAELIVRECATLAYDGPGGILEHFGVEEHTGWVCPKCGVDRTQAVCPRGDTAALTGECPMIGVAQ